VRGVDFDLTRLEPARPTGEKKDDRRPGPPWSGAAAAESGPKEADEEKSHASSPESGAPAHAGPAAVTTAFERTPEEAAGRGEPACAYDVEVAELLEMEPPAESELRARRPRPWHRYASAAFFIVFVLGALNAAAVLLYHYPILTPDELTGGTCEVSGEVRDIEGNPISNATIVVTDSTFSAFTNADGWYVLKGLPAGKHRVEAAGVGYNVMSVRVDLRAGLLRNIDFTLEKGGTDVRLDESGSSGFSQSNDSYLWATPLLLAFSVLALAAAILSLRKRSSKAVLVLGAAGALSFGFGLGSAIAIIGVLLSSLELREGLPRAREGPRVRSPRPCEMETAPARTPAPDGAGLTIKEKYSVGVENGERVLTAEAEVVAEKTEEEILGAMPNAACAPAAPAPTFPGRKRPPAGSGGLRDGGIVEVPVVVKEKVLAEKMAAAEIEPSATLGTGEVDQEPGIRPRRFVRRSKKGRVLCFVCVNEVGPGQEYIRCSCGKTMHAKCLREPRCPDCGCSFSRGD
jgi:hypothetical protein